MAVAEIDLPDDRITGHDLTPLLKNPNAPRNIPAQSTYADVGNNMVRLGQNKLIQYKDGSREIYDLEADPEEFNNLAGKSTIRDTEAKLEKLHRIAIAEGSYPHE